MSDFVDNNCFRVWLALVYPESMKPNWIDLLRDMFVQAAISPLHDKDVYHATDAAIDIDDYEPDYEEGDMLKPHYHLVLRFAGKKSFRQVWDILKSISLDGRTPRPLVPRGDIEQAVQYLNHHNRPNKYQYSRSDIISLNGFDFERYFKLSSEQEDNITDAIFALIEDLNILEYYQLYKYFYLRQHENQVYSDMFRYVRKHTILYVNLIKSRRFTPLLEEKKDET